MTSCIHRCLVPLWGVLCFAACVEEEGTFSACPSGLAPGDIVITEILANPSGPDRGREWFELYNASSRPLDLRGFALSHAREDGSSERRHRMRGAIVEPGQFFVVGDAAPRDLPPHVDYGYGSSLGLLRNSGGRLAVACGDTELTSVVFGSMADGVAWGFDGQESIHYLAATNYDSWCRSRSEYSQGEFGTPGAQNDACQAAGPTAHCAGADGPRQVRPPRPGDVVISEFMPSSGAVPDARGEWIELRTFADVDLAGLQIALDGSPRLTLRGEDGECLEHPAGSYVLSARDPDPEENGGLSPVDFVHSFFLPNSGDRTLSLLSDGEVIDEVRYAGELVRKGQSIVRDLDSGELCVTARDPEHQFGDGDFGSPRAENPPCPLAAGQASAEGTCESHGAIREVRAPKPGDIQVSEMMPNPGVRSDADGEWFELFISKDVDLNGLQIRLDGGTRTRTLEAPECIEALAASYVLLAREEDPERNGGLTPDFTYAFFLPNSGQRVLSLHHGEELIDLFVYGTEHVRSGVSTVRDFASDVACLTPREEFYQFGDGDFGTPGAENPSCFGDSSLPPLDEGDCEDDHQIRPIVSPAPGDIFFSEIMANNQSPLLDRDGEWFELLVMEDVDLNGVEIFHDGHMRLAIQGRRCARFLAGSRVLFARNDDETQNGGLPPVDFTFSFNIVNRASSLQLYLRGELLDSIEYPSPPSGRSAVRDITSGVLCHSPREPESEYFTNNYGFPGANAPICP